MIILDTETTGLPGTVALPEEQQPEIIEFAALKLDDETLEEVDSVHFMCKPRILPLDPIITKITGIRTEDLMGKPAFVSMLKPIVRLFRGETHLVAHNLPFDRDILWFELKRLGHDLRFPWPWEHCCTAELTSDILGKPMKQEVLYEHATGKKANQTHRALDDCRQLAEIVRWMRDGGRI
jgi:DNA polymerase III epsilon subunit-like protein